MIEVTITVKFPDGRSIDLKLDGTDPSSLLADRLESSGARLNTRCGKQGVCRGCMVKLQSRDGRVESHRSCQLNIEDIPLGTERILVTDTSWRDDRLSGISDFEIGSRISSYDRRPGIGLAMDIGTTTVAMALWDLETGKCLGTRTAANQQRRFGDNVLARIEHSTSRPNGKMESQQALVRDTLEPILFALCRETSIDLSAISEATATGNTVMLHTLVGASLEGLRSYPFEASFHGPQGLAAESLGLSGDFEISVPECPGAFVGADITMGAWASGMLEREVPALLIDIGTNGEILLKHEGGYLATATAAGPAFEGGRLTCGAAASDSVISRIGRSDAKWKCVCGDPINNKRPSGISGAAYVDFIAEARDCGLLNEMGRFDRGSSEIQARKDEEDTEYFVTITQSMTISETDIAELIQAKAAIMGGIMTLLELANIEPNDLRTIYVAGGFGYYLDIRHAMRIGLIPTVPIERIDVVGNSSLGGASLMLQSQETEEFKSFMKACRVIELNQCDSFEDHFIDCMALESVR